MTLILGSILLVFSLGTYEKSANKHVCSSRPAHLYYCVNVGCATWSAFQSAYRGCCPCHRGYASLASTTCCNPVGAL
ncbi:hypothetical protein PISMIDRAFT_568061 [Pisolithus microcarpus 441]|uniref:Unplaced genomic scaffold scaffold_72, whole genome shotgun sequence n=1 Tax=Pisolithus microcarpus 441 TaxID=765257 RepID=A0A0C9ZML9_9AGAM|nr:hypothetical protein PISMIDRAFT_568061 [Pisolithus microcarpus 441]